MKSKGFALMTVLIIVIIVPIVVFGITIFITSSLSRYDAQTRNTKALYLAQAGIHRAIYQIKSTGTFTGIDEPPFLGSSDRINVPLATFVQSGTSYQFKSTGTSNATNSSPTITRTVSAQYAANNISLAAEGDTFTMPTQCSQIWWPFSEGIGTVTGTAPYVGTLGHTAGVDPAWTTGLGTDGHALTFNNGSNYNNYVLVPDSNGLDLTTTGTIMAWINITTHVTSGIVVKGASDAYSLEIYRQNSTWAQLDLWVGNTRRWRSPVNFLGRGTWYHVAVSWGPGKVQGYKNGAPGTSGVGTYTAPVNTQALYIGTATTAATAFKGKIDEVYLFGCQKTDAEIKTYYNSTCAGSGATPCPRL